MEMLQRQRLSIEGADRSHAATSHLRARRQKYDQSPRLGGNRPAQKYRPQECRRHPHPIPREFSVQAFREIRDDGHCARVASAARTSSGRASAVRMMSEMMRAASIVTAWPVGSTIILADTR